MPKSDIAQSSEDQKRSGIECLPSCFESSEIVLEHILVELEKETEQDALLYYLSSICTSFGAKNCIYIKSSSEFYDRSGDQLSQRTARELCSAYGFLFKQRVSIRFNQASPPLESGTIYVPLDLGIKDQTDEITGILLSDVSEIPKLDDSIQVVLSAIYAGSNAFSAKTGVFDLRMRVYDKLKKIYQLVGREICERRFQAFNKQLEPVDLHFEPIVEFSHSSKRFNIYAFEALARLNGLVPSHLFEVAELWGVQFQIALDISILKKALTKYLHLLERNKSRSYNDIMPLAVNVYPSTILSESYRSALYKMLEDLGFPGHKLILEISEKDVFYSEGSETDGMTAFVEAKEELKKRRVKIAIDDFGTGNSSLLRVQKIMPDYVKIDRQILLYQPKVAKEIISQLINIKNDSHNRMFSVVVEGLDEEVNLNISISELVNELEVDYIQGHLLARAADDAPQRLDKEKYLEIQKYLGWAS